MQKMKKFFAVLLSVLMITGTIVTTALTASAKDFTDVKPDDNFSEQIDMLSDMGIIVGTSEIEFNPESNITREQMALLLYRLMMAKNNAGTVNTSPFTDLYEPSYNGAVSWAYACRYILGTGSTTFDPKGGITLQDALAMITRALGQTNDNTNAGYPWSYIDIGTRLGLTNGLENVEYTTTLTRAQTAALLHNALSADYIISKTVSGVTTTTVTNILENVYGYKAGSAVLVSTNNFALPSYSTVVKTGYALLNVTDNTGKTETIVVKESDLGLAGDIDSHIGEDISVFYKTNSVSGIASILGAASKGTIKTVTSFTTDLANTYISIDGVKYTVVEKYSDKISTNANELIVYAFDVDGTLVQLKDNAALAAKNGFFTLKMFSDSTSDISDRAILMPLTCDKLEITSGSYNIAGGLNSTALTGGIVNNENAVNGDLVLYYFNNTVKRLVIADKLDTVKNVQVTKLTSTTATIGDKVYTLGVAGTDFTSESVKKALVLGTNVDIVVYGDSIITATATSQNVTETYNYLVATSVSTPVVYNNTVCYFMTAYIGGKEASVYVTNSSVTKNALYRYTETNGVLTLIDADDAKFTQSGEIKTVVTGASSATIAKGGNVYYTLKNGMTSVNFVTDKDTVIVVKTATGFVYRTGAYASTFTVNDGANIVAIMKDETGSVEKLNYLFISDGALGSAVDSTNYVQIVNQDSTEFVNGKVMTAYIVFNCKSAKVETLYSEHNDLVNGNAYALDENGNISGTQKVLETGKVNGYTSGTITIGDMTYTVASDAKLVSLEKVNDVYVVKSHTVSDIYDKNVNYVASGSTVSLVIVIA